MLGNLIAVTLPNGSKITYIIDPESRRVGKEINGVLETGFLYDGGQVVAQLNGSNQIVSRFVYATGAASPDYIVRGGVTYSIFSDQLGSPILIVNASTGAIVEQISYDEFGNVLRDTNPGFQPFGFAGGLYDQDTKLVRFGARDYDPNTGRWTAKDPTLFDGGDSNLYGYVGNDPINFVDPEGLSDGVLILVIPNGSPNDQNVYRNAQNYQSPDGTFTVILHGTPGQAFGPDGKPLTGEQLAHIILNDQDFILNREKYKKIRLVECRGAKEGGKGKSSVKDQLQNALRWVIPVESSDSRVQINGNGTVTNAGSRTPATFY